VTYKSYQINSKASTTQENSQFLGSAMGGALKVPTQFGSTQTSSPATTTSEAIYPTLLHKIPAILAVASGPRGLGWDT